MTLSKKTKEEDSFFKEGGSDEKPRGCFGLTPYINNEGIENIKIFKYNGSDTGPMYLYFYNPIAIWAVSHTPEWIAPNIITLVGFVCSFGPFLYMVLTYGTQFGENAAPLGEWFILSVAILYFFGRLLDEMDGKQARKTGNSSPLGLLFDHGCDSFIVGFMIIMTARIVNPHNPILNFFFITSCVC